MNGGTLLHRQVNPSWIDNGQVTSQAFRPTPKDRKRLSVYDGDLTSPEEAWKHFTSHLKKESVGVLSVFCQECEDLELPVESDPQELFQFHAIINFCDYGSSQIRKKSRQLTKLAWKRGWRHQADENPESPHT